MHRVLPNIRKRASELRVLHSSSITHQEEKSAEDSGIRTGLWAASGWNNGIFSAGFFQFLEDHELHSGFDAMGGSAAGAWNITCLQARQMEMCRSVYFEENCRSDLIKYKFPRQFINLDILEETLRYTKPLKVDRVRNNPCPFVVSVSDLEGVAHLIDVKGGGHDVIDALMASTVPPTKDNPPRILGGRPFVTGVLANPLPLLEFSIMFGLTDLLVVLNEPKLPRVHKDWIHGVREEVFASLFIRPKSPGLIKSFLIRNKVYNSRLAIANSGQLENGCRIYIAAPPPSARIPKLSKNRDQLKDYDRLATLLASEII